LASLSIVHLLIFFFFSSRRRHTRSKRDWSSDVCSSEAVRSDCCRRGAGTTCSAQTEESAAGFLGRLWLGRLGLGRLLGRFVGGLDRRRGRQLLVGFRHGGFGCVGGSRLIGGGGRVGRGRLVDLLDEGELEFQGDLVADEHTTGIEL